MLFVYNMIELFIEASESSDLCKNIRAFLDPQIKIMAK